MSVHSIETDNFNIESKINLRKIATKDIPNLKILDLFAGENKLWRDFEKKRYYGVEIVNNKGKNLNADNMRVIQSLDLSGFNVIDVDSYGIPANQIDALFKNGTMQDGTVIIYTCITNKMSSLNKTIIEMFNLGSIYKKAKTVINGKAKDLFYGMLYDYGVREVYEYQINKSFQKTYGYFAIKN